MPRILLIISGGIAAYKSLELIRLLARRNIATRAILTEGGSRFVTPLAVAAITRDKVHTELFDPHAEVQMSHIELSRSADLIVVCPATADIMARAAQGMANDLATTALLATDKPVLMVPAMNVRMWQHAATQANLATLRARGIEFFGPVEGSMACGEFGPGRLPEPPEIADAIERALQARSESAQPANLPLAGRHAIVTAGPTIEPLDPVRFLSNRSSGKQGYAIAESLARAGARVTLVSGPTSLPAPSNTLITRVNVSTAREMLAACTKALPADIAICVAAVADYRPESVSDLKLSKDPAGVSIRLVPNPDILATLSQLPAAQRPKLVVGFAAQTHDVEQYAQTKLERKGCDWIVANDVSGDVMGGDENQVSIIRKDTIDRLPRMKKTAVADAIIARIAEALR